MSGKEKKVRYRQESKKSKKSSKTKKVRRGREVRIVLMGNPGAGKSTILNTILAKHVFESGSSVGAGLTTAMQEYRLPSKGYTTVFVDTPGLDDFGLEQQMANEIAKAILPGVETILCFVGKDNAGRIDSALVRTISIIMKSFEAKYPFTILVNMCAPTTIANKAPIEAYYNKVLNGLGLGKRSLTFIPMHRQAFGVDNVALTGDAASKSKSITSKRTCVTQGVTIELKRCQALFTPGDDDEFERSVADFTDSVVGGDFVSIHTEPCSLAQRTCFGNSKKAHCKHCMYYKMMKRRNAKEKTPNPDRHNVCKFCCNS